MPEISFYILSTASVAERDIFVCKLVEKAYRQGVYSGILTASSAHSQIMDDLLWTYHPARFIPHQQLDSSREQDIQQIGISDDLTCLSTFRVLVNISQQLPQRWSAYERILEILHEDDGVLAAGRARYRQYQQAEATLTTHKL